MSVNDLLNQEEQPSIKRDRYGRYLLPDPETGEVKSWTRATTVADTLADRFALEKWMQRNVVLGIGRRADLFAKAASVASIDERDTLNTIIDEAFEAAASATGANLGTALHRFAERVDAGETVEIPEPWRGDIEAYRNRMDAHGIFVMEEFSECVLIVPEIETAGTADRILTAPQWSLPKVGDLKSGRNVADRMTEIALQLAIYAHASYRWDPRTKQYDTMPAVDQKTAIVMHLPVGTASCVLYEVDIEAGWEAVQLAMSARAWRKRKDLAWELPEPSSAPAEVVESTNDSDAHWPERLAWIRSRVEWLVGEGHGQELAETWTAACPHVPTFRNGGPRNSEEIDGLAGACALVELAHKLPFFDPPDPALTNSKPKSKLHEELLPS